MCFDVKIEDLESSSLFRSPSSRSRQPHARRLSCYVLWEFNFLARRIFLYSYFPRPRLGPVLQRQRILANKLSVFSPRNLGNCDVVKKVSITADPVC